MYGGFHNVQNWLNVKINKKVTCKLEALQVLFTYFTTNN